MVHVTLPFLSMAMLVATGAAAQVESYQVPSFDYSSLDASHDQLLAALQTDGIVAIRNIPKYQQMRAHYLAKAAECTVAAQAKGSEFLLHRVLADGTKRYTMSAESGRMLVHAADETKYDCPGYAETYRAFSHLIEDAVVGVGRALDSKKHLQIDGKDLGARALLEESVHLDHFHAYEPSIAVARRRLSSKQKDPEQLSLSMHTDNGLMIAMTAPEYFDVQPSGAVKSRDTRSEDAGLLIETAAGKTVRPSLHADELVLMMGSGIDQWIKTTPRLRPVLHGMKYPDAVSSIGDEQDQRQLRAWFGKMILLHKDHVMANTGLTYGEYANKTTRYLMENEEDGGFAAVACPPHRRLQPSARSCMTKTCKAKAGVDTSELRYTCQITCNHASPTDEALCKEYCECESKEVPGTSCWMLCVANLDESECSGEQKCNSGSQLPKIAMTCLSNDNGGSSTTTPSPVPSPQPSEETTQDPRTPTPSDNTDGEQDDSNDNATDPTDADELPNDGVDDGNDGNDETDDSQSGSMSDSTESQAFDDGSSDDTANGVNNPNGASSPSSPPASTESSAPSCIAVSTAAAVVAYAYALALM